MLKNQKNIVIVTIVLLIAIYILNIIDYLQTAYAIQMLGINVELNPIARFCFEHNLALPIKTIGMLILLLALGFVVIKLESRCVFALVGLFAFNVALVLNNFIQLDKVGLFDFDKLSECITITSIICAIVTTASAIIIGALCAYYTHLKKK